MAGRKFQHLTGRIRQKLGAILQRDADDPRFRAVTISSVELAKDLSFARVRYSCYQSGTDLEALTESLNRAAGFFAHALARTLETRSTPRLQFEYDAGFDHAQRIDEVLDGLEIPGQEP